MSMPIPAAVKIKQSRLPDAPGVYFYYNKAGELLYIGKATSLKKRVGSYFNKKYERSDTVYAQRIGKMVGEIARIDSIETPTVIEALVLEANQIRLRRPRYNVMLTDDKSFLSLVITNEAFPKPLFKRGLELAREGIDVWARQKSTSYLAVYGPFTSPRALRNALDLLRKIFPWSVCDPPSITGKFRPCFYAHLHLCPGVCTGAITKTEYRRHMRNLMRFFEGKKGSMITALERDMKRAAKELAFEKAGAIKRQIESLQHIRDISVITKDFAPLPYENPDKDYVNALGRVEAYDISNISGTEAVGSMVVFEQGQPNKAKYRKFRIKSSKGPNDVAMMKEVMERRLARAEASPKAWPLPDVMVIDGGKPQVNAVQKVLDEYQVRVPIVGLAKGPDRKRDALVFDHTDPFLARIAHVYKEVFQRARDEAHRFAVAYHRKRRSMRM